MLPLGFTSAILPDQSFEQVLQIASQEGYDCVEVMCWPPGKSERRYAGVSHIDVSQLNDEGIETIAKLTQQYGVQISSLGYYPNPLSPDASEAQVAVQHIHAVIEASSKLGIGKMTTFIGRDPQKTIDENWPSMLKTWTPIVEHAERHNVQIGIENCPMLFTADEWPGGKNLATTPAIWRRMFTDLPSRFIGLNYDPSHLVWQGIDPIAPLREFADRLVHVHAKDVRLDRARLDDVGIMAYPNDYHTPKLPGMGEVSWGMFFSVLGDVGYRGPVCVEVEDRVFEESELTRVLALRQSHTFLRNYLPKV